MSRVGKKIIDLPAGVTVGVMGTKLVASGPKGRIEREMFGRVSLGLGSGSVSVLCTSEGAGNFWGLYRTLLNNMVVGVSAGYVRVLELHGTGYRASVAQGNLTLNVGYSHPVVISPVPGIGFDVDKAGKVIVSGIDKETVGLVAANVRGIRAPEPYHGKGIRYLDEVIVTKVGKSSGKK